MFQDLHVIDFQSHFPTNKPWFVGMGPDWRQAYVDRVGERRARLAREIHDGLAQTIGYLKLRAGQIAKWLADGRQQQAEQGLRELHGQLDDAYLDAREAIEGLRIEPGGYRMGDWVDQTYAEFRELAGIELHADSALELALTPEVQIQLIRILQESLGNVRKHSGANNAWIQWVVESHWLTLRVRDDGSGFDPDDVPPISRHGLRIMRERAELLGADFQISSQPGQGTEVIVRLPYSELAGVSSAG